MALFEELTAAITAAAVAFDEYHTPALQKRSRNEKIALDHEHRRDNVALMVGRFIDEVIDGALIPSIQSGWKAFDKYHTPRYSKPEYGPLSVEKSGSIHNDRFVAEMIDDALSSLHSGWRAFDHYHTARHTEMRKSHHQAFIAAASMKETEHQPPSVEKTQGEETNDLDLTAEYDVVDMVNMKEKDVGIVAVAEEEEEEEEEKSEEKDTATNESSPSPSSSSSSGGFVVPSAADKTVGLNDNGDHDNVEDQKEDGGEEEDAWCLVE